MRRFSIVLAILALVGPRAIVSQSVSDLPACGQTCINNELGLATSLGCSANDIACLCADANFGFGIRDCAQQSCSTADASAVVAYVANLCSAAGVSIISNTPTTSPTPATSSSRPSLATSSETPSSATPSETPSSATSSLQSSSAAMTSSAGSAISGSSSTNSPSSSQSLLSQTPSKSTQTSAAPTSTSAPAETTSSQKLSAGAIAGIAIGAIIGVLILCVMIYIAFLLRRQHHARLSPSQAYERNTIPELGPGLTPEMDGVSKATELDATKGKAEKWLNLRLKTNAELQG